MRDLRTTPRFELPTVKEATAYPLSDGDIRTILGDDISILPYPALKDKATIDDVLDKHGRAIILYLNESPTVGHWVCLLRTRDGIEFFDPYGDPPDTQVDDVPAELRTQLEMDQPYLSHLLANRRVRVNRHRFQAERRDVNTCGRWYVARLLYAGKPLSYFKRVVEKSGLSPNEFVVGLTARWLKK